MAFWAIISFSSRHNRQNRGSRNVKGLERSVPLQWRGSLLDYESRELNEIISGSAPLFRQEEAQGSLRERISLMVLWFLKLLAILPSGSAGKFLKKIWNLEKLGGEEAIFASALRPLIVIQNSSTYSPLILRKTVKVNTKIASYSSMTIKEPIKEKLIRP